MEASTLKIKVVSEGLDAANTGLTKLSTTATKVNDNVQKLTISSGHAGAALRSAFNVTGVIASLAAMNNSIQSMSGGMSGFSTNATTTSNAMNQMANQARALENRIRQLETALVSMQSHMNTFNNSVAEAPNSLNRASRSGSIWNNTLKSMAVAATAYIGVNFISSIIEQADGWQMMQAKLNIAVGSMQGAKIAQADLLDISQRLRVPLADTVQLYTRMSLPMMALGKSARETKGVVEGVALALKLSGATGAEASSVMLQFSQSMNAGRLNGAEFNSVAEGAPLILRAIETELRRTGDGAILASKGLKKMASEGLITAEIMANAINNANAKMRADFDKLPLTVDGALTRIKNAWQKAIGDVASDTKFNEKMAESLKKIEEVLPSIARAIGDALLFAVNHGETFLKVIAAMGGIAVLSGLGSLASGIAGVITSFKAAETAAARFKIVMTALSLTPWGLAFIAIGLAIAGATIAYNNLADAAEKSREKREEDLKRAPAITAALEAESLALKKQIDLIRMKNGEKPMFAEDISSAEKSVEAMSHISKSSQLLRHERDELLITESKLAKWKEKNGGTYYAVELNKELAANQEKVKVAEKQHAINMKLAATNAVNTEQLNKELEVSKNLNAQTAVKDQLESANDKKIKSIQLVIDNAKERNKLVGKEVVSLRDIAALEAQIEALRSKGATSRGASKNSHLDYLSKANEYLAEQEAILKNLQDFGVDDKRTKSEKELLILQNQRKEGMSSIAKAQLEEKIAITETTVAREKGVASLTAYLTEQKNDLKSLEERAVAAEKEAIAREDVANALGKVNESSEKFAAIRAQEALDDAIRNKKGEEYIALLDRIAIAKGATAASAEVETDFKEQKKLQDDLDKFLDPTKAQSFGEALKGAFGEAGGALGKLTSQLGNFAIKQSSIEEARAKYNKLTVKDTKQLDELNKKTAQLQIGAYGDIAAASKTFFKEGSKGYKVMEGAEKAFRATEIAMAIENMVIKSGLITGFTGIFTAAKATETAVDNTATGNSVINSGVRAAADGVAAVAKSLASLPFPMNLAAGAATLAAVAALGIAITGGFSGDAGGASAADVQKSQGTGSVFGDSTVKSDSIAKSLSMLEKYADNALSTNKGMATSLKNIDKAMSGLANIVARTSGLTTGEGMGIQEGSKKSGMNWAPAIVLAGAFAPILKGLASLWGKTTTSIVDSGLKVAGTLSQLTSGAGVSQYASVDTKKSSWFGAKKSTKNTLQTQGVGADVANQFGLVFQGLNDALKDAAKGLGMTSGQVDDALKNLVIDASVSLKGLKGEELAAAINSVVSKAADTMANSVISGLLEFAKVGEGTFETLVRVSSELAATNDIMSNLGFNTFDLSVAGVRASQAFIDLFGDIDKMTSVTQSYYENFYSEEERTQTTLNKLGVAFAKLGETMPVDRAQLRAKVDAAVARGDLELAKNLMLLGEVFASVTPAAETLTETTSRLADATAEARSKLTDAYNEESSAIQSTIDKFSSFSESVSKFRAGLLTGDLSTLTPQEKYATARAQYDATLAAARAGDTAAQGDLTGSAQNLLTLSKAVNASGEQYQRDFAMVLSTTGDISDWAAAQANIGRDSLTALNLQVDGLLTVNESVLTVGQAIQELALAITNEAIASTPTVPDTTAAQEVNAALVEEIRKLNIEVAALRADQREQTNAIIMNNSDANAKNANAIIEDTKNVRRDVNERVMVQ